MSDYSFIQKMASEKHYAEVIASVEALNGKPVPMSIVLEYSYALEMMGREVEALDIIKSALSIDPSEEMATRYVSAICRLCHRRPEEVDELIAKYPNNAWLKAAKGEMALQDAEYDEGFRLQRHRWAVNPTASRRDEFKCPEWDGSEFDGPLLVIGEQGLGEDILFSSALRNLDGTIVMGCDPRLISLFKRSLPHVSFVPRQALRYFDQPTARFVHAMDLFGLNDRESVTATSWLKPDQKASRHYRKMLDESFPYNAKVGLSWKSSRAKLGESKSIPLKELHPITLDRRFSCISLQYGNPADDYAYAEANHVSLYCIDNLDLTDDIDGVAALITALDCVVTCSNTVAHLAGALGAKTYLMAPGGRFVLWYWGRSGSNAPFYPSVEIFRGPPKVTWENLARSVSEKVKKHGLTEVIGLG